MIKNQVKTSTSLVELVSCNNRYHQLYMFKEKHILTYCTEAKDKETVSVHKDIAHT